MIRARGYKANPQGGKVQRAEFGGNRAPASQRPLLAVTWDTPDPSSRVLMQRTVHQGSSRETSCPKILSGVWAQRHLLPNLCQNSRFSEGKQVFSIKLIIYTHNVGTMSHSTHLGKVLCQGRHCTQRVPTCQPRASLPQVGVSGLLSCTGLLHCPPVPLESNPSRAPGVYLSATYTIVLSLSFMR